MTDFISTIQACINTYLMLPSETKVLIAVSGGADSMALLSVLYQLQTVYNLTLIVAHVNHQLRGPESIRDAMFVKQYAEKLGLPFHQGQVDVKQLQRSKGLSPQHAARLLRHEYLQSLSKTLDAKRVALGHTADDQIETFLVRLLRGTGSAGLAGIPPVRMPFIRPLITTHRTAILAYLTSKGIAWVEDSTNLQRTYLRNRVRLDVLPMLQQINPQVSKSLIRLTHILSAENAFLERHVDALMQQVVRPLPGNCVAISRDSFRAASLAIQRRLLRRLVDVLLPPSSIVSFDHIESLRQFVIEGMEKKRLTLPGRGIAECHVNTVFLWHSEYSLPITSSLVLPVPGQVSIPELGSRLIAEVYNSASCNIEAVSRRAFLALERLCFPLEIRFAQPGDQFHPLGASGPKKLKEFFVTCKIPRVTRAFVPLVVSGTDIVWVVGYRIAEPFKVHPETQYIVSLQYETHETVLPCILQNK